METAVMQLLVLLCCISCSGSVLWRPCTDLLPLDLLDQVVPAEAGGDQGGIRMVQSQGSTGLRFSGSPQTLSFSSSLFFTHCSLFPAEFSVVVTLKIHQLITNKDEYVFSLLSMDQLLLGLRLHGDKLHFLYRVKGRVRRATFRKVRVADGGWHTMVLALGGHDAALKVDCSVPLQLQLQEEFPEDLDVEGSRFFVGSRRRRSGTFTGLMRQLVLVPGSDASSRVCLSSEPELSILSVPQILLNLPIKPLSNQLPLYPYEAELRVTQRGAPPVCVRATVGQLWFNTDERALYLCNGSTWITMMHEQEKLDYVEDHQNLFTHSETFDVEVFQLPPLGLFIATANRDSSAGSSIYRWTDGRFQRYQNIDTYEAQAWKFFTVENKRFLVVANSRRSGVGECEFSVIYKWNSRKQNFVVYQKISTYSARDWEAFRIHDDDFLAVANHRRGEMNHNIESVIYRWNRHTRMFEVNQTISTSGAYDWEFFTIGPFHFLVVANTFNGRSTNISSSIYIWLEGRFQLFQEIMTYGAIDWEMFQIGNRFFLAVANSQKFSETGSVLYSINSTIYELNNSTQTFIKFQDIVTSSALDWEFFTVGDDKFLVVANSYDGASYSINSVIYRWQGYEGFVPVHKLNTHGCKDWEFFTSSDGSYLISSSARAPYSKVLKLKTYYQR